MQSLNHDYVMLLNQASKYQKMHLKQQGYSLLEILIASVLSLLIFFGVFQVLDSTQRTSRATQQLTEIQDNGRFVISHLERAMRYRGFQGCKLPVNFPNSPADVDWSDEIVIVPKAIPQAAFQSNNVSLTSLRGFTVGNEGTWTPDPNAQATNSDIQALIELARPGSDVISLQYPEPLGLELSVAMSSRTDAVTFDDPNNLLNIQQGDYVFISDCNDADVFRVTNAPGSGATKILQHSSDLNDSDELSKAYGTSAEIRIFRSDTYFVADTGRLTLSGDSEFALFRHSILGQTEELTSGVEFLRLEYGSQTAAGNLVYQSSYDPFVDWAHVVSIRLGVLMQAHVETLFNDDMSVYTELPGLDIVPTKDNATGHQGGRYLREAFLQTVKLRNGG